MINECLEAGEGFGVALIAGGTEAGDPLVEPHEIGSIAEIVDVQSLPFGRFFISTIGRERFRIRSIVSREPFLTVEAELLDDDSVQDEESDDLRLRVRSLFAQYVEMLVEFSGQETNVELPGDAAGTSYLVGDALQVAETVKQRLLELDDTKERLRAEFDFLERLLPQLGRLLERRRLELQARVNDGEDLSYRADQEKFFGKFFSLN